jgi:hypothetical protein
VTNASLAHPAHPSTVEVESNSRPGHYHAGTLEPESCSCEATVPVCRHIRIARIRAVNSRPRACNDGWVTLGQTVVDPDTGKETEEFALYLCRRCADSL